MKAMFGTIGFLLVLGGAGNSDCGGDFFSSIITALVGLCMMGFVVRNEV